MTKEFKISVFSTNSRMVAFKKTTDIVSCIKAALKDLVFNVKDTNLIEINPFPEHNGSVLENRVVSDRRGE